MQRWLTLDDELDADTGFRSRSLINIAADAADMDTLYQRQAQMHAEGHHHEKIIDQQELRERLPHVAEHCVGGVVSEDDGYAIPYKSTFAFRNAALRYGARFLEGQAVHKIRKVGQNWLIESDQQRFECRYLVNCAGAWADKVAVMTGDNTPMSYSAPMLMITTRIPC